MANKFNSGDNRTRSYVSIFIIAGLCCFFYLLGAWQRSGFGKGDSIALEMTKSATECNILPDLSFEIHHGGEAGVIDDSVSNVTIYEPCSPQFTDYTPCHDQARAMTFPRENMVYRERHCPPQGEKMCCMIPATQGFPGGGTQFPQGADKYIDQLASVIPIANGTVRTALDTGCGVASWGAYLWDRKVLAMSFAPRDSHEAQVQFALERGVLAVIGVLGTIKIHPELLIWLIVLDVLYPGVQVMVYV